MEEIQEPLYDRVGGEMAIMAATELLYRKLLADELTARFFTDVDMATQSRKLMGFLTWAFGGPVQYRGKPLREAHAKLVAEQGLSDTHFDAVVNHLAATLEELEFDAALTTEIASRVASLRAEVLSR
ncbi:MAG TPA: group 1 truncated hemoglobin [Polyangiaceae bacterium]|jgi:hemoglobin